jgi:hypothetical protein
MDRRSQAKMLAIITSIGCRAVELCDLECLGHSQRRGMMNDAFTKSSATGLQVDLCSYWIKQYSK